MVGSYAILPGDAEGQSKLVAVEQGDDNAWSPSGETETIVPVQTDALTEITPQEGQSYYPPKSDNVEYIINFNNDLLDGTYTVVITDDSGNEFIGLENHQFQIETILPEMSTITLSSDPETGLSLDTGTSNSDRSTTVRKPNFNFQSEEGLRIFIEQVVENGKEEPEQEAPSPNIITLAEEDGIKDAEDNPVVGSYAILPGDAEGQSKLVAVEQGDDNAWSPSGETETVVPVQTDALTEITPQEGQSYYPTPAQEQEAPAPNIITLAEEDGIKDAEDNPVVGSYAILPGDAEGQSKLVAVEQGDDNAWSPSGETETIVPVQTDALTEITPHGKVKAIILLLVNTTRTGDTK